MYKSRLEEVLQKYEPVIGLEIHTEITATKTKMFCGCPVEFGGEENSRVCPVCLGMPGALPVPNEAAVEWTLISGLATGCKISRWSQFHRKNYFYPDMPKNYQISQDDTPFCYDGCIEIEVDEEGLNERIDRATSPDVKLEDKGYTTNIGITRIHLEEDTGKMVHVGGSEGRIAGATHSLADFNRASVPLMELVSEPDIRTPEEARQFAQKIRLIFQTLGVSDCNMDEGSMRVDANISLRPRGEEKFGTKAELKNMNSFKALHDGLVYEIIRQAEILDEGGKVIQETRHFDMTARVTSSLRAKETADDYRYFPEPDMLPFSFSDEYVESLKTKLPELPDQKFERYMKLGLPKTDARPLANDYELSKYFDQTVEAGKNLPVKSFANYIINDLAAYLNEANIEIQDSPITPAHIAELVSFVEAGDISTKQAKEVFEIMAKTPDLPSVIIEREGIKQVSDTGALAEIVDTILAANPDKVEEYRNGKKGLMGFFVGQVMRETQGTANPKMVNEILNEKLEG